MNIRSDFLNFDSLHFNHSRMSKFISTHI